MENLQISSETQCHRIQRCGTEVLRIFAPVVTGTTPAATHAVALIDALVAYATQALANNAEAALRTAVKQGALLHFTHRELCISLVADKSRSALTYTLSILYKSGQTVYENSSLTTYWSADEDIQYRRPPRQTRQSHTRKKAKRFSFFSRATLRARANCDKI